MNHQNGIEVRFDLAGLFPALFDNELRLELPTLLFIQPILNSESFEVMKDAGLTERDIEDAVEDMIINLQTRLLAQMLIKRRM